MLKHCTTRRCSEKGIALLISIFVLLLISVVAIALLVSSGTEAALGANYRASSTVYYAALAGLEEARGRLLPKNPSYFGAATIPSPFPLNQAVYVLNRLSGETVAPADSSNLYYDKEYQTEFGVAPSSSWPMVRSVWDNNVQGIPGPVYKWVRINAATEQSLFLDVDSDGTIDPGGPAIYYDPAAVDSHGNPAPSLIRTFTPPGTAAQVLQITALAALPNGSQKILQYLVVPSQLNLNAPFPNLPSALTLAGNNVGNNPLYPFSVPNSAIFLINGNDQFSAGTCTPGPNPVSAIGYSNNADASQANINNGINNGGYPGNYTGVGGAAGPPARPSLSAVAGSLAANLQTVSGLNSIVQMLTQNADVVLPGGLTQSDSSNYMPSWMSSTNPATVVVNGDFTMNGWHSTGTGILLVTGQFNYDPDASWDGLVLVIGKGVMYAHQGGSGRFHGAVFLATTVDASGNPLPTTAPLGSPSFSFTSGAGSYGIYYSSCLVQFVQTPFRYKVLSFHEIPQ